MLCNDVPFPFPHFFLFLARTLVNGICVPLHGLFKNNVLLDADYIARLADFGYASSMGNIPEGLAMVHCTAGCIALDCTGRADRSRSNNSVG